MDMPRLADTRGRQGVTLLVVRPHPDDESSATGSMLAYYHTRGVRTGVVICTGGEEGEIRDPSLDPVADRPRLRQIREREVREACAILGVAELRMLGYRDSGMKDTPANAHPDAFCQADLDEAAGRLVRIIRELRPLVIVTEPPGGAYAHPDHVTCYHVSVAAFHAAADDRAYPEAGPAWPAPKLYGVAQIDDGQWEALLPELKAAGFDIGSRRRRKAAAALVRRRRRWRSMSAHTVTFSAGLCSLIALRFRRIASGRACPKTCAAVPFPLPTSFACTRAQCPANTSRISLTGWI